MCLRLVYLIIMRVFSWLRLSPRDEAWKSAEILLLPHQLTVLQRQTPAHPKMTWADRALIAALVELIARRRHASLRLIITPQTVLRWRHDVLRRRWAAKSQHKRPGRPATHHNITRLVVRLARENPGRGYRRIHGELAGLGIRMAPSTAWEILTNAGLPPAPRRGRPTCAQFLHGQAQAMLATDFCTVDLLDGTTAHVLAVIEHATAPHPDPRRHRPSGQRLGHPAGPQPAHGPRPARRDDQVPASRSRHQVHRRLRRRVHRRGNPDPTQPHPSPPGRTRSCNVGSAAAAANCSTTR
jgi:hypothetical protein